MEPARPLHDVFADLAEPEAHRAQGSPSALTGADLLRANGHPDLPEPLVAEAVVSYADTAPHEVAEHLAPFVQAHSSVPLPDVQAVPETDWVGLLASAPRVADLETEPDELDDLPMPDHGSADPGSAHTGIDVAFGQGDVGIHEDIDTLDEAPAAEPYGVQTRGPELADPAIDGRDEGGPVFTPAEEPGIDEAALDDLDDA